MNNTLQSTSPYLIFTGTQLRLLMVLSCWLAAKMATGQISTADGFDQEPYVNAIDRLAKSDLDSALLVATNYLAAARADGDSTDVATAHYYLGVTYQNQGNFKRAIEVMLAGRALVNPIEEPRAWSRLNNRLGTANYDIGLQEEAMKYYRDSYDRGMALRDSQLIYEAAYNIGNAYSTSLPDSAIYYFETVQRHRENLPFDPVFDTRLRSGIARAQYALGRYDASIANLEYAIKNTQQSGDARMEVTMLNNLVWSYARSERVEQADTVLDRIYRMAGTMNLPYQQLYAYSAQILVDSIKGNWEGALRAYGEYTLLTDSLRNQGKIDKLTELENSYANQQKEREIEAARRENEIISLRNKSQRTYGILLFFILALVAILAYVLWRRNLAIRRDKEIIQQQNEDKTLLMQEIHHRAKNNLTTIEALLNLQLDTINGNNAREALQRSRERIQAISLIHDQLYKSDSPGDIGARDYLTRLLEQMDEKEGGVAMSYTIDDVALDLTYAVPVGLILNEVVANSLEHAFRGVIPLPLINVDLSHEEDKGQLRLTVKDNGTGLANPTKSLERSHGGAFIIRGLVKQLKGKLNYRYQGGTVVEVTFPYVPTSSTVVEMVA